MRLNPSQAAQALVVGAVMFWGTVVSAQVGGAYAPEPEGRLSADASDNNLGDNSRSGSRDSGDARIEFKPLSDVKLDLVSRAKQLPADSSDVAFNGTQNAAPFSTTVTDFHWEAANFFHRPLYFDDTPLERYGQSICPVAQPIISGTRFFLTFPILPYKMGVDRPQDCVTSYGLYRPGNCAPCVREVLPRGEKDAVLFQTATTLGWIFLLP